MGGVAAGFCAAVELSDAEREELLQLCRQRLDAFREQRGEEVGCLLTQKPAAWGTGAATAPRSALRREKLSAQDATIGGWAGASCQFELDLIEQ